MISKLLMVSGLDPKNQEEGPKFENDMKKLFWKNGGADTDPCLIFIHKGTPPQDTAEKVKKKKPPYVIFGPHVPAQDIVSTIHFIKNRTNGSSPEFGHITGQSIVAGVTNWSTAAECATALLN